MLKKGVVIKMKKFARKMNNMMFDLAVGPTYLAIIGFPLLVIAVVVILIVVTLRLIKRASAKKIEKEKNQENSDSSAEDK